MIKVQPAIQKIGKFGNKLLEAHTEGSNKNPEPLSMFSVFYRRLRQKIFILLYLYLFYLLSRRHSMRNFRVEIWSSG